MSTYLSDRLFFGAVEGHCNTDQLYRTPSHKGSEKPGFLGYSLRQLPGKTFFIGM